jgi:membrane fusion protein (multidrug efflux system)
MLIAAGTPIVSLDDVSVIRVDFAVPDRYLSTLRIGLPIAARPTPCRARPSRATSPRSTPASTRPPAPSRPAPSFPTRRPPEAGHAGQGRHRPGRAHVGVAVPESAVQFEGTQASVFRIAKGPKGMIARRTDVDTGISADGFVEIRSGMKKGDKIVADGLNRIQDGAPVGGGKGGGGRVAASGGKRRRQERRRQGRLMLSDLSVRRPVFAAVAAIILCVIGLAAYRRCRSASCPVSIPPWCRSRPPIAAPRPKSSKSASPR